MQNVDFDLVIIGGFDAPLGLRFLYQYSSSDTKCCLFHEDQQPKGAGSIGNKTTAQSVMKGKIEFDDKNLYDLYMLELAASISALELIFEIDPNYKPYTDTPQISARVCLPGEKDFLSQQKNVVAKSLSNAQIEGIKSFLTHDYGIPINTDDIIAFEERSWNVPGYVKMIRSAAMRRKGQIKKVKKITIVSSTDGIIKLEVLNDLGESSFVYAKKVIVARGIGNFEKEKSLNKKNNKNIVRIKPFYKPFVRSTLSRPLAGVNTLTLAMQRLSFASEAGQEYSIISMDNRPKMLQGFNYKDFSDPEGIIAKQGLQVIEKAVADNFKMPAHIGNVCAMVLNSESFNDPSKNFELIMTPSDDFENVTYANLTFFTGIENAFNKISTKQIKDL